MQRMIPRTFFGQLVLGTLLAQTFALVLFSWYTIVAQHNSSAVRSRQRMQQQLDILSQACAKAIARQDTGALRDVLNLSHIATSIDAARLTDLQGRTLAVTDNGRNRSLDANEQAALPTATRQHIFQIRNGQLEAVSPVLVQGSPAALLWLEPNHSAALNTTNLVLRVCLTYGGFALLANLLPIFIIVRRMTRPLKRLRVATRSVVSNAALNTVFPLPVTTRNEAGQLTASFNAMARELSNQRSGLLETLALLDSMLGNAPIGFAFFNRDLHFVRINDFLADAHGAPAADHVGRRPADFYPASIATEKESCIAKVFRTGEPLRDVELSGEIAAAPGVKRSWVMHFYPVRTHRDTVKWVGVIVVDVTDRLRAEEALRKTEKLAAAGRLAASIAHEINNPLESVTNLLYLLETDDRIEPEAAALISTAQAELARVSEITQQTLCFYRQSTAPCLTNVAEVLGSVLALYHPRLVSARVNVVRDFSGEPTVFGFSGELRQIFANLIGNALDAMPDGGRLYLRLRQGCGRLPDGTWGPGTRIAVADSGSGMSPETAAHIFEAFFTTKQATGTGLGLWVSDEIIRKHGGTVRVRSRRGQRSGTIFMLFFPAAIPDTIIEQPAAGLTALPMA